MTVKVEREGSGESSARAGSGHELRISRGVVVTCFLVSGATALAYEVVWVRLLTLVFGATVLSVGAVLAAYMAGLALGSWYWSRRVDQSLRAVRFLLCLPALMLPTFLMGGTLPVLARFYTSSLTHIGRGAGDLYAVNTFGAVTGTLAAAAGLNFLIAGIAYVLSQRLATTEPTRTLSEDRFSVASDRAVDVVLIGFGVSGFAAMIYEVAWTRALIQIFGNSTYAFTTMLASFLVGIALGAAVAGRFIDRAKPLLFIYATLRLILGAWAAAATPIIEYVPVASVPVAAVAEMRRRCVHCFALGQ